MRQPSTDPIADMLTRIRNAIAINKSQINLPHSNTKEAVAKILKDSGFIIDLKTDGKSPEKALILILSDEGNSAKISEIQRISTPGRRHYAKASDIPVVKQGRGIVIISTSKGIMSGDTARVNRIGGELICKVY
jgi:small subunit ribosomal protein S8